jgi:hypothetical protein
MKYAISCQTVSPVNIMCFLLPLAPLQRCRYHSTLIGQNAHLPGGDRSGPSAVMILTAHVERRQRSLLSSDLVPDRNSLAQTRILGLSLSGQLHFTASDSITRLVSTLRPPQTTSISQPRQHKTNPSAFTPLLLISLFSINQFSLRF